MGVAQQLYALQTVELKLDAQRKRLAQVEEAIGETEELRQARAAAEAATKAAHDWQAQQRHLELEAKGLDQRIRQNEQRLYSGAVRNPKELQNMQDDLAQWQRLRRELDDKLLEAMVALEEAQAAMARDTARLAAVEKAWQAEQAQLAAEREALRQEVATLEAERGRLLARVPPADLGTYDQLRKRMGRAVAVVQGGACGGCGIALPHSVVWGLGSGDQVVHCPNCERILVAPSG